MSNSRNTLTTIRAAKVVNPTIAKQLKFPQMHAQTSWTKTLLGEQSRDPHRAHQKTRVAFQHLDELDARSSGGQTLSNQQVLSSNELRMQT